MKSEQEVREAIRDAHSATRRSIDFSALLDRLEIKDRNLATIIVGALKKQKGVHAERNGQSVSYTIDLAHADFDVIQTLLPPIYNFCVEATRPAPKLSDIPDPADRKTRRKDFGRVSQSAFQALDSIRIARVIRDLDRLMKIRREKDLPFRSVLVGQDSMKTKLRCAAQAILCPTFRGEILNSSLYRNVSAVEYDRRVLALELRSNDAGRALDSVRQLSPNDAQSGAVFPVCIRAGLNIELSEFGPVNSPATIDDLYNALRNSKRAKRSVRRATAPPEKAIRPPLNPSVSLYEACLLIRILETLPEALQDLSIVSGMKLSDRKELHASCDDLIQAAGPFARVSATDMISADGLGRLWEQWHAKLTYVCELVSKQSLGDKS